MTEDTRSGGSGPPEVVNLDSPSATANMYGCEPCPKCGSVFRAPYEGGPDAGHIVCGDCGYRAPFILKGDDS